MSNETKKLKEFQKLLNVNTNDAYKEYVKAQKKYLSVLTKFVKNKVAKDNNFEELFGRSLEYCIENQNEMYWAWLEDKNNEIKVLNEIISGYEFELLNPEEFDEESIS